MDWNFSKSKNQIIFDNKNDKCTIDIYVSILQDGTFMISYTNHYHGETTEDKLNSQKLHPLYERSKTNSDILNGIFVASNIITFHMIESMLTNDISKYDTNTRPYNEYCGKIMNALIELEF